MELLVMVFMTLLKNSGKILPILNNSMLYQDIYIYIYIYLLLAGDFTQKYTTFECLRWMCGGQ